MIKVVYGMIGGDNDDIYMTIIEYTYTSYSQAHIIFWILVTLISIAVLMIFLYALFLFLLVDNDYRYTTFRFSIQDDIDVTVASLPSYMLTNIVVYYHMESFTIDASLVIIL